MPWTYKVATHTTPDVIISLGHTNYSPQKMDTSTEQNLTARRKARYQRDNNSNNPQMLSALSTRLSNTSPTANSQNFNHILPRPIPQPVSSATDIETKRKAAILMELDRRINVIATFTKDWNSYGSDPPSRKAIELSREYLNRLASLDFLPDRVLPSAEGGVGFVFLEGDKYADIEIFNDGEVYAGISGDIIDSWEFSRKDLEATIRKIRGFLRR